jgi:hypothetical protein
MSRTKRIMACAALFLAGLALGEEFQTYGTPGQTLNGGVVMSHGPSCGLELWGDFGTFCTYGE